MLPEAKPHLAFAGTEEGAVQLWNLREPGASHPSIELGEKPPLDRMHLRSPTYASDCLAMSSHTSPVASLAALPISGDAQEDASLSIASLDVEGTLIIWLVLEAVELDAHDLGQAVGSKERLMLTGSTSMTSGVAPLARGYSAVLPTKCVHFAFVPTDPTRVVVGTDLPQLLHRSRYSSVPLSPDAFEPGTDVPARDAPQNASGVASIWLALMRPCTQKLPIAPVAVVPAIV